MKLELLNREEIIGFVKWTTANLRDDKKLPTTYSVTRMVTVWEGREEAIDVDLTPVEVVALHTELGFITQSENITL